MANQDSPTPPSASSSAPSSASSSAFPEQAQALRSRIEPIIALWIERVRQALPSVRDLSDTQLRDDLPAILEGLAEFLAGKNGVNSKLVHASPEQGLKRFSQNYDMRTLMHEDRLLRGVIAEQLEAQLARRMTQPEAIRLHEGIDIMLQQAVVAFADQQTARLRAGAESELKYLSFLSHDLNNNLGAVTLFLQLLRQRLGTLPEFAEDVATLDQAQETILKTIGGMGRLLQSERLRKQGVQVTPAPVNLHRLTSNILQTMLRQAEQKGLRLTVDCPPDAVLHSDGELLTLALQNLLGNGIKYSSKGTVRISCKQSGDGDGDARPWTVTVIDEGPGIAREHLERIFQAFARGEAYGQSRVGLGLAIASQAAKLLGGELTVESALGIGSKFRLTLPPQSDLARNTRGARVTDDLW